MSARKLVQSLLVLLLILTITASMWAHTYQVLYSFVGASDGYGCNGVIQDAAGNLYGTNYYGGAFGAGTIFRLDTTGNFDILYTFTGMEDGLVPLVWFSILSATSGEPPTSGEGLAGASSSN